MSDAFRNLTSGTQGILSVELLPPMAPGAVSARLAEAAERSTSLRAAVAYWTLDPTQVSPALIPITGGGGFVCVDIHLPTSVDILADMKRRLSNVYVHLQHPAPGLDSAAPKMPPHLLHTKMLLFDLQDSGAELWVGSHNWTARALHGLNMESSLIVNLQRESDLYISARLFLENVRRRCVPFDLSFIDYYKWLQGEGDEGTAMWSVRLVADEPDSLRGARVTIYGVRESELKSLRSIGGTLLVRVESRSSGRQKAFLGRVSDAGFVRSSGIVFEERLHAFASTDGRALVQGPSVPEPEAIERSFFWASLDLTEDMPESWQIGEAAKGKRWIPDEDEEMELRLPPSVRTRIGLPQGPLVYKAQPVDFFRGGRWDRPTRSRGVASPFLLERVLVRN